MFLLVTSLFLTGCTQNDVKSDTQKDTVVTVAHSVEAEVLDPGMGTTEGDIDLAFHIYDGLVAFKNKELEIEPALATDWNVSEDGKTWTFELREGIKFHDGTDFNAEAVAFSFMRILDENHEYHGVVDGSYSYLNYLIGGVIEEVVAVDEHKVEFKLNQKFAPFLTYMGYYSQFIISPSALKENGAAFGENPVGTGPFKFEEWKRGEYIKLTANEDYWGEVPEVDTLFFRVIPEASTRLMELQSGSVDVIKSIDPSQLDRINEDKEISLQSIPGANVFFVSLNTTKKPFNDVRVRQALNHAINKERIIKYIYENNGTKAINFMPPTLFAFDKTTGDYEYNPEKAKQLLADAGYEDGFELTINSFQNSTPFLAQPVQAAELMKEDLQSIGIDVGIETNEWGNHAAIMNNKEHDLSFAGWFDIPYPSNFLKTLALEGARTGYAPEDLQQLALDAWATYDREEQEKIYHNLQEELHKGAPIIPIAHNNYSAAIRNNLKGVELDNLGVIRVHEAYKE